MNLMLKLLSILTMVLIFSACGGDDSSTSTTSQAENNVSEDKNEPLPLANTVEITDKQFFRVSSPQSCRQEYQNRFIYQVMHDSYLWASDVPQLDYTSNDYNTSQKLLTALKSEKDSFSFIIDAQTAQSFFEEGKNNNFGMGLAVVPFDDTSYAFIVKYVYPNSPADRQGIQRGDIITLVAEKNITEENFNEIGEILENQETLTFTFWHNDNSTNSKTVTKTSYDIQTVLYSNIYTNQNNNTKVGYMVFQDFIENALVEIDATFKKFKEENVNELVLDLRYNGGGAVNVANHLSSLIGGSNVAENIFMHTKFNESYSENDQTTYFEKVDSNALNLNRVFVITTESTCSSSELVINALRASANNVEVIQIGSTTCGKPYGYVGSGIFCNQALYAINIESQNGDNAGDYTDGLKATCEVEDNIFKSFGDTSEDSLQEALNYISNNQCSIQVSKTQKQAKKSTLQIPQDGFKRIMSAY